MRRPSTAPPITAAGALLASGAYLLWGVFPLYFKAVDSVPALEILAHRVVWAFSFVGIIVLAMRRLAGVVSTIRNLRHLAWLWVAALVLSVNWGVFIFAVISGRVLEASLGYFINPLVSVILGVVVLGERLPVAGWLAVGLAAAGVTLEVFYLGTLPWIAVVLALSFAAYALIHKLAPTDTMVGLFTETLLLVPLALGFLIFKEVIGEASFGAASAGLNLMLVLAGPITALPLLLFVAAAKRITLATLGLFQYITPTCHFLLAVFAFGEPISGKRWLAFVLIWLALALYSTMALHQRAAPADG